MFMENDYKFSRIGTALWLSFISTFFFFIVRVVLLVMGIGGFGPNKIWGAMPVFFIFYYFLSKHYTEKREVIISAEKVYVRSIFTNGEHFLRDEIKSLSCIDLFFFVFLFVRIKDKSFCFYIPLFIQDRKRFVLNVNHFRENFIRKTEM